MSLKGGMEYRCTAREKGVKGGVDGLQPSSSIHVAMGYEDNERGAVARSSIQRGT